MSPRPKKTRNCHCRFQGQAFKPSGIPMPELEKLTLYPDELEAVKLCDYDRLNQGEAGVRMGVSRGTVQRTLAAARKKIAEALSQGKALILAEIQSDMGE
ncbi:MAG: DNA-binding protein [Deltaproteobacteria bacterium RIFOXYD12_FULL_57_12]|nr:MAG: DNA-binding protein [Deltaproteobacteria bacterium RIFOXYD12_FULL_57_12]